MKVALSRLALAALIASMPAALAAAPALRGIMHHWRADARDTHDMLSGRAAFDEAAIRDILRRFAADAGRVASEINGRTSAARDFKGRFVAFQAQSQAAIGDLGRRSALSADFAGLLNDCQSCHRVYNN